MRQVALGQPRPQVRRQQQQLIRCVAGTSSTSGLFLLGCPTIVAPFLRRRLLATYYQPGDGPGTRVPTADNNTRYASLPVFPSGSGGLASTVDDYLQFARMLLHQGAGFGFGVELKTERSDLGPAVGSFWWNGATGVAWTADPQEHPVFLCLIQQCGAPAGFAADYTQAVYQAIVD